MTKQDIIKDVCTNFPQFPTRSLARYVLDQHGGLWDYNLEKIRTSIRYFRGTKGELNRQRNKSIIPVSETKIMPKSWNRQVPPYQLGEGKWLVLADVHAPFHDVKALEAAIAYGQKEKCTGLFLNGDFQDCQAISFWPSVVRKDFMAELMVTISLLDLLNKEFPKAKKVYKPGNHEYRLPRYFAGHAPEFINSPVAAMESTIDFESRGYEFLDYYQLVYAGKLPILHGHEMRGISTVVNPARGLFLKSKSHALCAHFHRTSEHTDTNIKDEYLTTWSIGCLSNLHPDYNPYGGNWNWGFAVVSVDDNGYFTVHNKRILPSGKVV